MVFIYIDSENNQFEIIRIFIFLVNALSRSITLEVKMT